MHHSSVRRRAVFVVGLSCAAFTAACEDKRVKQIHAGMPRDSAISAIAQDLKPGSGIDSLPNVYLRERYLIAGKNYEVLYFTPNDEKPGRDTVKYKKLTPLVLVNQRVVGRGWDYWDSLAKANKIPVKNRDSVAK